ncbi:iron complex transport system substrate-binding protein [Pseudobutyrivibrio sp. OR37]|uniref:iron-siderophore ABC transporter substrate-binding protein n=1 Tax=Pseudobutyrivibrio sp. OR37 TaxID=1798186 RepID=UPI0008E96B95|nr:iron-siderophore ABC transporter substrate-binding protein [Pseudobutyrivibrio sp. OR37]SFI38250.1 iron complex transport system substrate-binding protein [Pseudobutyrivibrio sp. OR37]
MKKRLFSLLVTASIVATSMIGCGATSEKNNTEASVAVSTTYTKADAEFPITIKHAFGETTIESKPERIVNLGWANQDTTLALGVVPVGVSAANYGKMSENKLHLWTDEAFTDLSVENPNVFNDETGWDYEAIAACEPDIIIASYSGFTEEEYNLLSEIAPVIPYLETAWKTNWREQTITNATAMGMKAEGEKLVEDTDALIAEKLADYPELNGKTAGYFWISQDDMSTFYAYLPNDPRASYLNDLGLKTPESILSLASSTEDFSVTISRENTETLNDVDIMVVYGDKGLLEAMQADPLMSQIPAVKNGAVVLIDSTTALAAATTPSILSIPYAIDDYLSLLSEAANKIETE